MKILLSLVTIFILFSQETTAQTLREKVKKEKEARRTEKYGEIVKFKYLNKNGKLKTIESRLGGPAKNKFESEAITLYTIAWQGRTENGGTVYMGDNLYLKRPNEKYPQHVGRFNIYFKKKGNNKFRKLAGAYFSDYTSLRNKILANVPGYRPFNIEEIVKKYSDWKTSNQSK